MAAKPSEVRVRYEFDDDGTATATVLPALVNGRTPADLLSSCVDLTCPCGCGQPLQLSRAGNDEWAIARFDCARSIVTWGTAERVLEALLDNPVTTEEFLAEIRRVRTEMWRQAVEEVTAGEQSGEAR